MKLKFCINKVKIEKDYLDKKLMIIKVRLNDLRWRIKWYIKRIWGIVVKMVCFRLKYKNMSWLLIIMIKRRKILKRNW